MVIQESSQKTCHSANHSANTTKCTSSSVWAYYQLIRFAFTKSPSPDVSHHVCHTLCGHCTGDTRDFSALPLSSLCVCAKQV